MKQRMKTIGISLAMGVLLPYLFLSFGVTLLSRYRMQEEMAVTVGTEPVQEAAVSLPVLFRDAGGNAVQMDMDTYLVGVVLAEMPAFFEMEALKAQSCVARTYAGKAYITGGKHGDGSVCGEPSCCQGYTAVDTYLASGGTQEAVDRVRSAISATTGQVLTYDGELIEATYFSCSGGRTEDAVAVWGTDFPYLQAVDSPGEEQAAYYTDEQIFSPDEFARLLQLPLTGDPADWIGTATYTEGGGVHSLEIGGESFSGTRLRSLLGLRSTAFSVAVQDSEIRITTRGYGHRVGMSQYGADAMAASGSSWQEILAHYYRGTELTTLS